MSEQTLPDNWIEVELGQINHASTKNIDPASLADEIFELYSVPSFPTGKPEIIPGKDIGSTKQTVEPDDVLVCKINPRINRVWVVKEKSEHMQIASSEWIVVRNSYLEPRFLRHFFTSQDFRDELCADVTGVGGSLTRAQPKRVTQICVPIAPCNEQKRIAEKLDQLLASVDSCKTRLDTIPGIIKRFRQSVLAAATSGELTADWREEHQNIDQWNECSLSEVTDKITDGEHLTPRRSSSGRYLLSARNVLNGRLDLQNVDYVDESEFERIRKRCNPMIGDVLLSCSGSVGRAALVDADDCYVMVRSAAMIRPIQDKLLPSFLMFGLQSPAMQLQILEKSSATAQSNIFLGSIKSLELSIPSIPEQQEIVRRVEALFVVADRLEARYQTARTQVVQLTPSLLAKAFRGKLVPQDPNDEPAEKLLERIRAKKDAAPAKRQTRRKDGQT